MGVKLASFWWFGKTREVRILEIHTSPACVPWCLLAFGSREDWYRPPTEAGCRLQWYIEIFGRMFIKEARRG